MRRVIGFVLVMLSLWACKKEEPDYTPPIDYLTGGIQKEWVLSELYINDKKQDLDDCVLDDTLTLRADYTFNIGGRKTLCEDSFDYISSGEEGEWRVSSNDEIFYLLGINQFGFEAYITSLSSNVFILSEFKFNDVYKYVYVSN